MSFNVSFNGLSGMRNPQVQKDLETLVYAYGKRYPIYNDNGIRMDCFEKKDAIQRTAERVHARSGNFPVHFETREYQDDDKQNCIEVAVVGNNNKKVYSYYTFEADYPNLCGGNNPFEYLAEAMPYLDENGNPYKEGRQTLETTFNRFA